jgi:hypothetical protein
MKNGIVKHTEKILLSIIWIVILIAPLIFYQQNTDFDWDTIFSNWINILPFFILFLVNHFLLIPYLLFKNKKLYYLISSIAVLVLFSIVLLFNEPKGNENSPFQRPLNPPPHQLNQRMPPGMVEGGRPGGPPAHPPQHRFPYQRIINSFIVGLLLLGFDAGMRMNFYWSKKEKERAQLEKENIQNQLAFLRNQVSPHFFMNTLNNIHSLIDINTEEAKEAIIRLSKLMRHLLYDSNTDRIPLARELEFISSYIKLMKLRYSDKVLVNLEIPASIPPHQIPPLLFTSFVENAFKHGISYQKESFIKICFKIHESSLDFEISNSLAENKKAEESSGIGIENSKKRLDILYGKQYTLNVVETATEYQLKLNIPI